MRAVPMLARSAPPLFAPAAIGSIGSLDVNEGEFLKLALSAAGLDSGTTIFSAEGLPLWAHLDAATGLFVWRPNGTQEGSYSVRFEASDGSEVVSEDVTITVHPASLSIGGTARLAADGSPVPGVAVQLSGTRKRRLTGYTDAQGRFRFDDLVPDQAYRLRLSQPSKREYRMYLPSRWLMPGASDITDLDLDLSPR